MAPLQNATPISMREEVDSNFSVRELAPLSRFRSISMVALPLATIIFCSVPLPFSLRLSGFSFVAAFCDGASAGRKSKSNGSMKAVSVILSIVFVPPGYRGFETRKLKSQYLS